MLLPAASACCLLPADFSYGFVVPDKDADQQHHESEEEEGEEGEDEEGREAAAGEEGEEGGAQQAKQGKAAAEGGEQQQQQEEAGGEEELRFMVRFQAPDAAAAAVAAFEASEAAADGSRLVAGLPAGLRVVEGEEEEAYHKRVRVVCGACFEGALFCQEGLFWREDVAEVAGYPAGDCLHVCSGCFFR